MSRKCFFFQFVTLVWNHILSLVNLFHSLLHNTLKFKIIWAAKLVKLKYSCLLYYNLLLVYFRHHHYKLNFVYYNMYNNIIKKSFDCEMFICSILEHFLIQKFVLSLCFPKNFDAQVVFIHNSSTFKKIIFFMRKKIRILFLVCLFLFTCIF